jgi:hypothetical protein
VSRDRIRYEAPQIVHRERIEGLLEDTDSVNSPVRDLSG